MDDQCSIHLGFIPQSEMEQDVLSEAVDLARNADIAVIFVGNTTQWETEGQDLSSMTLPADGSQDHLISSVAAVNPNTIVVNTTGVPVELPWLDEVPALMQAWYAGQETGNAILDILLGEASPSGKLPVSWPKKYEHTGCYGNFGLDSYDSRQVEYVEDLFVGYRWFDRLWGSDKEVRYPFGFGLSYTSFTIGNAAVAGDLSTGPDAVIKVSATMKNVGAVTGAETVQVYVAPPPSSGVEKPVKGLVGFTKVHLQPGETKDVVIEFRRDGAAHWDETGDQWKISKGTYEILVATSAGPKDVGAKLQLEVEDDISFAP